MTTLWMRKSDKSDEKLFENVDVVYSGSDNTAKEFGKSSPISTEEVFLLITPEPFRVAKEARYFTLKDDDQLKIWIDPLEWDSVRMKSGKFITKIAKSGNQSE